MISTHPLTVVLGKKSFVFVLENVTPAEAGARIYKNSEVLALAKARVRNANPLAFARGTQE